MSNIPFYYTVMPLEVFFDQTNNQNPSKVANPHVFHGYDGGCHQFITSNKVGHAVIIPPEAGGEESTESNASQDGDKSKSND
ncbi:hypothetical protein CVT26_003357 [Gymnopilus dilepis]|uniref:Uncharacterized protein n=1 Tax=Gymnopilus dilepis TaxID=231916 RepID=A0A409VQN5_9AGAR|nr:hypothetical protein CVT26_003357 [Gymnopilus dilepis]